MAPANPQMSPQTPEDQDHSLPRLPGQSFAIEYLVREKKSKLRPFLGADMDDPKRFVPFVPKKFLLIAPWLPFVLQKLLIAMLA